MFWALFLIRANDSCIINSFEIPLVTRPTATCVPLSTSVCLLTQTNASFFSRYSMQCRRALLFYLPGHRTGVKCRRDTDKRIHKTLGQFIAIYFLYFSRKFGSLFYTKCHTNPHMAPIAWASCGKTWSVMYEIYSTCISMWMQTLKNKWALFPVKIINPLHQRRIGCPRISGLILMDITASLVNSSVNKLTKTPDAKVN